MPDKKKHPYLDEECELENKRGQDLVTYFQNHRGKLESKEIRGERITQAYQNLCCELGNLILMKEEPWKKH